MFAVTGISGNVGSVVARNLLESGQNVRAIVRDKSKGDSWAKRSREVAVADIYDAAAMTEAFKGAEGVFILIPPVFDPKPDFPEAHAVASALKSAIAAAKPGKVVYLSTIGADAKETNLLTQHTIIEEALRELPVPITFLRPAWFMENASWDVATAQNEGMISSFLQPLDRAVPMVATADIGKLAAQFLLESWTGSRIVELEGPARVTPHDVAGAFSRLLGRPVKARVVPRESWESLFLSQGMQNPLPRIRMLDGFNEGWIDFERGGANSRKGVTRLEAVLQSLIERANKY
ncbi:MAG: NmrA family NAD(P)-binding protein [Terracidiphilus sp.]